MHPCIVHRDSKLLVASSYPVVMGMPSALLSYNLDTLHNASMVVTDEADFLTTSGGKDVWKLLNFFKHGKHLKKTCFIDSKKPGVNHSNDKEIDTRFVAERQFVFVAATLPSRGKKASLNVLSKWIPSANVVTTSMVHQKLPSLDVKNVKVTEENKFPQLMSILNQLAREVNNSFDKKAEFKYHNNQELHTKNSEPELLKEGFDIVPTNDNGEVKRRIKNKEVHISAGKASGLRVMVFTNTAQQASKAFQYLTLDENKTEDHELNGNHTTKMRHTGSRKYMKSKNDGSSDKHLNNHVGENDFDSQGTYSMMNKEISGRDNWKNNCAELHKDVPIQTRLESLEKFKRGELEVLICTDIASRGLDIPDVTHVIQVDFASNAATFLHRTGRTARAGSSGKGTM